MIASCLKNAFDPTCPNLKRTLHSKQKKQWDHEPFLIQRRHGNKRLKSITATQEQKQEKQQLNEDPELLETFKQENSVTTCIQRLAQLENIDQLVYILDHLNLQNHNGDQEDIIFEETCRQIDNISQHHHAVQLLSKIIAPQLKIRKTLLSRPLSQQLLQVQNHRALLQGLVLEYISTCELPTHNNIMIKLIQQCSPTLRQSFIHDILQKRPWKKNQQDLIITLIDKALTQQPLLTALPFLDELLNVIRLGVQLDPKVKNYMQLLLTLTSKYGSLLTQSLDTIEQIAQSSDMFLKRAVLGQLTSIRKKLTIQ
ncbi:hypothetical protein BDC45DRAFT_562150 [Circinella umbellata]|nr:hypothetical protein BDC45DRAFT_562150 [Circinella umbellata]